MESPVLELKNIDFTYQTRKGETKALENLSFSIMEKEFVSLVGPSGCGKTTILSLAAGLISQDSGEILLCGEPVKKRTSSKVGYMFQRDNLFDWLNVMQNVTLGLSIRHKKNKETVAYAKSLIEKYGLSDFVKYHPNQLSGGMRQRAALIRTLATNPEILLLDEPFSALDYQTRLQVQEDVLKIIKNENKTAILVTHDISEAVAMSDRIIVLSKRPARVKTVFEINFKETTNPFAKRNSPLFANYFNKTWGELKSEEENTVN